MDDPLSERGGDLPRLDDLVEIARWLAAAGLATFEMTSPRGARVRMRVGARDAGGGHEPAERAAPADTVSETPVRSPYFGRLDLAPGLRTRDALVSAGPFEQGDCIGAVVMGTLSIPILAPVAGRVTEVSESHGTLIGCGETVAVIAPSRAPEEH